MAAGLTLLVAGALAAAAPEHSVPALAAALAVLGLGWNLGLVAGTTLIAGAVPLATRARTQGRVDLCIALAGAGGGIGSGLVVASSSYGLLAAVGGALALAIVPIVALGSRVASPDSTNAPGSPDRASVETLAEA